MAPSTPPEALDAGFPEGSGRSQPHRTLPPRGACAGTSFRTTSGGCGGRAPQHLVVGIRVPGTQHLIKELGSISLTEQKAREMCGEASLGSFPGPRGDCVVPGCVSHYHVTAWPSESCATLHRPCLSILKAIQMCFLHGSSGAWSFSVV